MQVFLGETPVSRWSVGPWLADSATDWPVRERQCLSWLPAQGAQAGRVLTACLLPPETKSFAGGAGRDERRLAWQHAQRTLGGEIERACYGNNLKSIALCPMHKRVDPDAILEGILLRGRGFTEFRADDLPTTLEHVIVADPRKGLAAQVQRTTTVCDSVNFARDLADLPSNVGTPAELVRRVRLRLRGTGVKSRVVEQPELEKLGMGLLCAVGQGSVHAPKLLQLEVAAKRKNAPTIVLIGKGVTHDTGGYNLKTNGSIADMSYDKCGAMAVIGAIDALARLGSPANVVALLPFVENAVDAAAYKPGDIIRGMDGTTVFVDNTDAEGRLTLADALVYARRFSPDAVIDIATLTGAANTSLGEAFSPLFASDAGVRDALVAAGHAVDEPLWPMPIHGSHRASLEHHRAHLVNTAGTDGSLCTAAAFLRHFVDFPWAHIDMAGKGHRYAEYGYLGRGATGYGVRLLHDAVHRLATR